MRRMEIVSDCAKKKGRKEITYPNKASQKCEKTKDTIN